MFSIVEISKKKNICKLISSRVVEEVYTLD